MLTRLLAGLALLLSLVPLAIGQTGQRKALLIGDNAYSGAPFEELRGAPAEDVARLGDALVAVGFARANVTVLTDLNRSEFIAALRKFQSGLNENDSVVFYFSGHGFSLDGKPYLVPIGFAFSKNVDTRRSSISLDEIIDSLSVARLRVVILDACRTSAPILKQAARRRSDSALAALTAVQANGSFVAYASSSNKPSSAASPSGMSLFTNFLVKSLESKPAPEDMGEAVNKAREDTIEASNKSQIPAIYNEMVGAFVLVQRPQALTMFRAPDGASVVNPYHEVKMVTDSIRTLDASRQARVQEIRYPKRPMYIPGQQLPAITTTISDDEFGSLVEMDYSVSREFDELKPKIEHAHAEAISYLRLGPIPLDDDERIFESLLQQSTRKVPYAEYRSIKSAELKPRFAAIVAYMDDLVNKLGHIP